MTLLRRTSKRTIADNVAIAEYRALRRSCGQPTDPCHRPTARAKRNSTFSLVLRMLVTDVFFFFSRHRAALNCSACTANRATTYVGSVLPVNRFPGICKPNMGCMKSQETNALTVDGLSVRSRSSDTIYIDITRKPTWVTSGESDIPKLQYRKQADTEIV